VGIWFIRSFYLRSSKEIAYVRTGLGGQKIIDVGEQVYGVFPGDRVAYMSRTPGAYTDIRCIEADACIPLPNGVSDIDASTLLKGVTAALLLGRVFMEISCNPYRIEVKYSQTNRQTGGI